MHFDTLKWIRTHTCCHIRAYRD